ncbi:hypothetical protein [Pseudomonas sp. BNK-30]|uniref:hypothetical protein n=1 Tax=Pseudomonas sp. BNK-30 TaxID=3376165 RepID=UPI0039BF31F2
MTAAITAVAATAVACATATAAASMPPTAVTAASVTSPTAVATTTATPTVAATTATTTTTTTTTILRIRIRSIADSVRHQYRRSRQHSPDGQSQQAFPEHDDPPLGVAQIACGNLCFAAPHGATCQTSATIHQQR